MKEENLSRRAMLKGVLALGCSMCLPIALSGCESKQDPTPAGTAPASAPPASTDTAAPPAPTKMSQASAQYQPQPKGELKCSQCQHFIAESNTCMLVEGQISAEGWCIIWTKKA